MRYEYIIAAVGACLVVKFIIWYRRWEKILNQEDKNGIPIDGWDGYGEQ